MSAKQWWWLSFVDPERAPGTAFLGVCIVQGEDIIEAAQRAWDLECNPGGEVAGIPLPDVSEYPESTRNRLLQMKELQELGAGRIG